MHRQFAVDVHYCTRAAQAAKKASGWAAVAWHPKPLLAITEGIYQQWSLHAVLHWECQTLQCSDCKDYPIPKEEAQEDKAAEDISFHVYEYKVSLRKDGKEHRQLELMQKHTKIGKFHFLSYRPALGQGRYHSTSYKLAARCRRERQMITPGSIGSHCDYDERMPLSFNKEIQSGYYQNMSVSIKGALLEWVNAAGATRTWYFGHWSDNFKQDAAATMHNMQCKLCVDRHAVQLVDGLMVGGTVWKGTAIAATSYNCGKSIYSQENCPLNCTSQSMHRSRRRGMASGGSTVRWGLTSATASSACAASRRQRRQMVEGRCSQPSGLSAMASLLP
jgi:hypothetical protein